jgi:hypothetical protein
MKILYHIRYPNVSHAERWIYEAWRAGFEALGHTVEELRVEHSLRERIKEVCPDLFMTDVAILNLAQDGEVLIAARKSGVKVALWVHWPLSPTMLHNAGPLESMDVADVYFGEREADREAFLRATGKDYSCIAHAASPKHHFPTKPDEKYASDILYIGARLPHKQWFEINVLNELRKDPKLKVLVIGLGWDRLDLVKRIAKRVCSFLGLRALREKIERSTVKIPPEIERFYYASAKICLNFHERGPDGQQPHYIINQRTFKIPACGGFEICDEVPAIRQHFTEDEMVLLPLDRELWLSTIRHMLVDTAKRERIRMNGMRRAVRDHYSPARCEMLLKLAGLGGDSGFADRLGEMNNVSS